MTATPTSVTTPIADSNAFLAVLSLSDTPLPRDKWLPNDVGILLPQL